ncbi:hypothetical protein BRARA_J00146 [Brassica rapa]|uniref:Uncharacterized protein n=1 Tax=Brassica campestris TaxID=3711 RepID=A0A397XIX0_BRACM|nr:hypothetical protein BRARA_J00146 [Brassica rapa]
MCKRRIIYQLMATAWLNCSKVSVCFPVKRLSSVSFELKTSTESNSSLGIGVSIPPTSRMAGTTALFTSCNTSTTNLSYLENSTQPNVPLAISS